MSNPPILEYGGPEARRGPQVSTGWGILIILASTGVMMAALFAGHDRPREKVNEIKCAMNLRQMGQAIRLYNQDNLGVYPPNLQAVVLTQQISPELLICVSSADSVGSRRPTAAEAAANLSLPNHCSYLYVGAQMTAETDPACVMILEDPDNHDLKGGNVLFADGHVEYLVLSEYVQVLNDLNAGRNPPTSQATLSDSAARDDYAKRWKARMPALKTGVWQIPTTRPAANPE